MEKLYIPKHEMIEDICNPEHICIGIHCLMVQRRDPVNINNIIKFNIVE